MKGTLKIYDLEEEKIVEEIKSNTSQINTVAVSNDASQIVTAGSDKTVKIFDKMDGISYLLLKIIGNRYESILG